MEAKQRLKEMVLADKRTLNLTEMAKALNIKPATARHYVWQWRKEGIYIEKFDNDRT